MNEKDISDLIEKALLLHNQIENLKDVDVASGLTNVRSRIRRHKRRRITTAILHIAAFLALPLLLSTIVLGYDYLHRDSAPEPEYAEITTAPGTLTHFTLPDNSKVWLNGSTTLRYPTTFSADKREVHLSGEGYFEVHADRKHPFVVSTSYGIQTMAYGTRFSVNTEQNTVRTTLAEGHVSILLSNQMLADLRKGQQAVYRSANKQFAVTAVNLCEALAWKDGKIIFRDAPLDEVFHQLGRRYNIDIVLHDEFHQLDKYRARVTFQDETIQQIFTYLSAAAPIRWKLRSPEQNADSTLVRQRIDVWLTKRK